MRRFLLFVAAAALAGCAALGGPGASERLLLSEVLAQTTRAMEAGVPEHQAALASAERALQAQASEVNQLRYATLLAVLPPPSRDEARALPLLQPLAMKRESALGQFAALLSAHIAERNQALRDKERLQRATERREDALKQQNEQLRKDNESLRQQADTLKQQQDTLRAQIEALRSIERSILKREDKLRTK